MEANGRELLKVYRVSYQLKEVSRQDLISYFTVATSQHDAKVQFNRLLQDTKYHVEALEIIHYCDIHRFSEPALRVFLGRQDVKEFGLLLQREQYEAARANEKEQGVRAGNGYKWIKNKVLRGD